MIQNRVLAVYFSIMRLSAIWAVEVMASASSRIMSLKLVIEVWSDGLGIDVKICFVPAHNCELSQLESEISIWRRTCEGLDSLADDIDTPVVAGVEL